MLEKNGYAIFLNYYYEIDLLSNYSKMGRHIIATRGNKFLLQPHFWKSVRMTFTLSKWGLWSPSGLSKF
jgi:hypothetical protein